MSTVLVGGGPAASGLLAAAARSGVLDALLDDGLTVISADPARQFGSGRLGGYLVRSDTRAAVFTECAAPVLGTAAGADGLPGLGDPDDPVPLKMAARLLAAVGQSLLSRLRQHPGAAVLSATKIGSLRAVADGVTIRVPGQPPIRTSRVILAVGGRPLVPPDLPAAGRLLLHSEQVLREGGYRAAVARLASAGPRCIIVGGSHSAFAVAGLLLRAPLRWQPGAITIAHRSPILVTYPDGAAARADGVAADADQICPATGVVHRFGGLRADAAALYRRVRDGGEPRIQLVRVPDGWAWLGDLSGDDPVLVSATGYESAAAGLVDGAGGHWDANGRLRADAGDLVPHVYGIGLGTKRKRDPRTGGEPAFHGAIDGVWFYQNVVAPELLSLMLGAA
jgi:hypothetical protein